MAARVLARAPERFALAGLSMGGYVALEIMRQAPERVTRLALLDTSAAPDSEARQAERQRAITTLGLGRFMGVTEAMLPQLVHESHVRGPSAPPCAPWRKRSASTPLSASSKRSSPAPTVALCCR
jgi:pimeloyl-ACP methyl ester carboxylesterase